MPDPYFFRRCLQPLDDTFQAIKTRYEKRRRSADTTDVGPVHTRKVLARDENWFITDRPEKWRLNLERKKEHAQSGHLCPPYVAYKPFANLKTIDAYDLVREELFSSISKHVQGIGHTSHRYSSSGFRTSDYDTIYVYDVAVTRRKKLPPSKTAGLSMLSSALGARNRTLQDVKAGSSLLDSLTREIGRQDVLQAIKAPKVVFQKGQPTTINKPFTYLPPMLPTASSKICLISTPPKSLVNPGGETEDDQASRKKKMNKPEDGADEEENNLKNLVRRNFYAKVKSIYAILCCLHNIKTRDLRTYKPFSFSTIKYLSKRPFHLEKIDHQHHFTGTVQQKHRLNKKQNEYHAAVHADTQTHREPVPLWEDILYLHEDNLWFSSNMDNYPHTRKQARLLPAWKRKVWFIDGYRRPDPAEVLAKQIKDFHYFKSEMAQKVATDLQERDQMLQRILTLNIENLVCGMQKDKSLQEMRRKTNEIRWAERKEEQERPGWYTILEEEVTTVFGEDGLEEQGFAALECLKPFMYVCTAEIPLVIEKLCMVAMSLPAHYLCIEQVILAFQFVSEFFLKRSPKLIEQLREIRQLPPVLDLHPPNYLFGMSIKRK